MGYIQFLIISKINKYFNDLDLKDSLEIQKTNENIDGDFTILLSKIIKNRNINRNDFIEKLTANLKNDEIISDFNIIGVFLNIKLTDKFLNKAFIDILNNKNDLNKIKKYLKRI